MAFLLLHNYTDFIYIKALSEFFDLEHTFIQETLNSKRLIFGRVEEKAPATLQ